METCSLVKNEFRDILMELIELSGYNLEGCYLKTIWDIYLKLWFVIFKGKDCPKIQMIDIFF